jgi:thiol:disulfide interchange protein DsbD
MQGFYLLGKIRFSHDSELKYVSVPRLFMAIVSLAFAVLWYRDFGASSKSISAFAPPLYTQDSIYTRRVHAQFDDYEPVWLMPKRIINR